MTGQTHAGREAPPVEMVTLVIDDVEVSVPKGTLVIRAAELIGVQIPGSATIRCSTPSAPAGSAWSRSRPAQADGCCTTTVTDGMVVRTQYTARPPTRPSTA
jgi:NADH-quinone oxidoreductase subunit G